MRSSGGIVVRAFVVAALLGLGLVAVAAQPVAAQDGTYGCCVRLIVEAWDEPSGSYSGSAQVYAGQGWLRLTFQNTGTSSSVDFNDVSIIGGPALAVSAPLPPGTTVVREVAFTPGLGVGEAGAVQVTATGPWSEGANMCACMTRTGSAQIEVIARPAPTTTEPPATTVAPPSTEAPATTAAPTTTAAPATTALPVTTAASVTTAAPTTAAPTTAAPTTTTAPTTTSSSVVTADVEITEAEGSDGGRPWVPLALAAGGGTTGLAALALVLVRRRRGLAGSEIYPS